MFTATLIISELTASPNQNSEKLGLSSSGLEEANLDEPSDEQKVVSLRDLGTK